MVPVPQDETTKTLHEMFTLYNGFGGGKDLENMDGRTFQKLCNDKKLICTKCTSTDVDLIFTSTKTKGAKKLTFSEFLKALDKVRVRDPRFGEDLAGVVKFIKEKAIPLGPKNSGTMAEAVRFHDDKESYTGVYKNGGPTNVDRDKIKDLSQLADRDLKVGVRGI